MRTRRFVDAAPIRPDQGSTNKQSACCCAAIPWLRSKPVPLHGQPAPLFSLVTVALHPDCVRHRQVGQSGSSPCRSASGGFPSRCKRHSPGQDMKRLRCRAMARRDQCLATPCCSRSTRRLANAWSAAAGAAASARPPAASATGAGPSRPAAAAAVAAAGHATTSGGTTAAVGSSRPAVRPGTGVARQGRQTCC